MQKTWRNGSLKHFLVKGRVQWRLQFNEDNSGFVYCYFYFTHCGTTSGTENRT